MKTSYTSAVLALLVVIAFLSSPALSQQNLSWIDPLDFSHSIHAQGFDGIGYNRLPPEAEGKIRGAVWNLSRHSAGLEIHFTTDASEIHARMIPTSSRLEMPHMSATGVSGLDLYVLAADGNWQWVRGNYSFKDTVSYTFKVNPAPSAGRRYRLYLPLYNGVDQLKLGVPASFNLSVLPRGIGSLPIVVYGTSIAQGACASRPGMAWPAIMGRLLGREVINLGFSGNGRLEPEVLEFIHQIPASVYILDCLPNLVPTNWTEEDVKARLKTAVLSLKEVHPDTPVVLVEHAGYSDAFTDRERELAVRQVNRWSQDIYTQLLGAGVEEIYYLSKEDIGLSMDATVDGTHPTDWGMQQYADAYAQLLEDIID